jgi:hypothetical protein
VHAPAVVSDADAGTARRAGGYPDPAPTDLRALQDAYLVHRDPLQRARYDAERARGPDGCGEQVAPAGSAGCAVFLSPSGSVPDPPTGRIG